MESLFHKPNLLFLIAIRYQSAIQLPTKNYIRNFDLFLKMIRINKRIGTMYDKCKRTLSQTIVCDNEYWFKYNCTHDLSLYPGDIVHFLNGKVHAEKGPAIIYNPAHDGKRYFNSQTGPAPERDVYLWRNGSEYWQYGKLHRLDGPARKFKGGEEWYRNGKLHREDGPATILHEGDIMHIWWFEGRVHREDGPAMEYRSGKQIWMQRGKTHRLDGPAYLTPNGGYEYAVNGLPHRYEGYAVSTVVGPNVINDCYVCGEKVDFYQDENGQFLGYVDQNYVDTLMHNMGHLLNLK